MNKEVCSATHASEQWKVIQQFGTRNAYLVFSYIPFRHHNKWEK